MSEKNKSAMVGDKQMVCGHGPSLFWSGIYVFLSSLLLAGCAGVCVMDVASNSVIVYRDSGTFREVPLYVREDGFSTLKRTEENTFERKDYTFEGKEVGRTYLPLLFQGYRSDDYAFSESGEYLAYLERVGNELGRHRLELCLVVKPTENILPAGVCNNLQAFCGYKVFWIDPSTILLYAMNAGIHNTKGHEEDICVLHLDGMRVSWMPGYYSFYGEVLLSPSRRYLLATAEMGLSRLYSLNIIDLKAEKEIAVIKPSGNVMSPHGAVWTSDEELVYAVDGVVYTQKIDSPEKREVFRMEPKHAIWMYAVDARRNLHYQMFDEDSDYSKSIGGWRTHNLDTHEDKKLTGEQITGRVLMNSKRNKIVAEVGY